MDLKVHFNSFKSYAKGRKQLGEILRMCWMMNSKKHISKVGPMKRQMALQHAALDDVLSVLRGGDFGGNARTGG